VCFETNAEGGDCRRRCDVLRETVPDPSGFDRESSVAVGWQSGYGGLTELEMKLTEDAVWTQFRLDDEVCRQGSTVRRFGLVRKLGTVVILTRPVQWTANAFTVRFATKVNRAGEQVQFGSIWRTCICENNKIVIVIIMCSKLMFLQRFKYTDHYYIANVWCSRNSARFVSCGF